MKWYKTFCKHCNTIFYFGISEAVAMDESIIADSSKCITYAYNHNTLIEVII